MTPVPRFDPWIIRAAIVVPCVLTVAQFLWTLAISSRLPAQIATHWSGSAPDGFMAPIQSALTIVILAIACAQIGWIGARATTPLVARKSIAVMNLILSGFVIGVDFAVIIPQIDTTDPTTASINWIYVIIGTAIGLAAGLFVASQLRDYTPLTDATVTDPTSPQLPHRQGAPAAINVSVTAPKGLTIAIVVWVVVSVALVFFLPALGIILLLCTPFFLLAHETGMTLGENPETDAITVFNGFGPMKMKHRVELRTIKYAKPGKYNWADGGGIGLRYGNDGRITVAARSGEAVKIETSGADYTVAVPDGMAAAVAGEINSRIDAMR